MTEADILALTYEDKVTVFRAFKDILPSGESIFKKGMEGEKVYENMPCALSRQTGGKLNKIPMSTNIPTEYSLFTRPEVDIQPKDYLVIKQLGKTVKASAGLAARLSSHNNIPLKLEEAD